MDQRSGFDIIIVNTHLSLGFSFTGISVVGYLCVFGFRAPVASTFFIPFGILCVLTIIILDSVILIFMFGFKGTLGVPSP